MNPLACSVEIENGSDQGYASRQYAESFAEFGAIRELPGAQAWLLVRPVPGSPSFDGMGCYPLFSCQNWNALGDDLESLSASLVCVSLVTDPFANVGASQLQATFPDVCYEYKQHFVTDLSLPLESIVQGNHRRNVRKAMSAVDVFCSTAVDELLPHWQQLYNNLIERHGIEGIAKFSSTSLERQMRVPGFMAFAALDGDDTCGMTLWYVQGDVAYYHLGAYSDRGYELGASFALFWNALTHFAGVGVRWTALGAGAGVNASESGLTRFKQGWATHTRPAYFCGRILQPAAYAKLAAVSPSTNGFFPAYRSS
jgi:hypothetical protein